MNDSFSAAEREFDDDELVAYLDGELDAEDTRRVEQLLAQDPAARKRLRELQSSWDLMDVLPRAEVNNEFTQTTVSMIALQEAESLAVKTKPSARKLTGWLLSAAGVIAAGILGFALVYAVYSTPEQSLLRNLPLIENMDMYEAADSAEFVSSLRREGLFNGETGDGITTLASASSNYIEESLEQRRARVSKMSGAEKEALQRKEQRFQSLSPNERQRLQDFHGQFAEASAESQLRPTLVRYYAWLRTLPAGLRKDVLSLPPDERLKKISKMLEFQSHERFKRLARTTLEDQDVQVIRRWVDRFIDRHKDELMQSLSSQQRAQLRNNPYPDAWRFMVMGSLLHGNAKVSFTPAEIPEEIEQLKSELSDSARDLLEKETDPQRQSLVIRSWVQAAHFSDMVRRNFEPVSKEELMRFIQEEASEFERRELEGLTAEQARREAERMYYQNEMRKNWEKMRGRSGGGFPEGNG